MIARSIHRRRALRGLAAAALASLLACGYGFATRARLQGGAERASVRPFENLSPDPELGAAVAAAVRDELARRGAEGEGGVIEGEVRSSDAVPSTGGGATWRVALEVRARLRVSGQVVSERVVRREADFLGGVDALETEGRRAVALRRLAAEAARDLVRAFEG